MLLFASSLHISHITVGFPSGPEILAFLCISAVVDICRGLRSRSQERGCEVSFLTLNSATESIQRLHSAASGNSAGSERLAVCFSLRLSSEVRFQLSGIVRAGMFGLRELQSCCRQGYNIATLV